LGARSPTKLARFEAAGARVLRADFDDPARLVGLLDSVQKGDLPGIGMVIIDGIVRCGRSRNTPPPTRLPELM
jgi:hypothetical protein